MKKATKKVSRSREASAMSLSAMADLLHSVVPELQESYSRADIELALDDRGWLTTKQYLSPEVDSQTRQVNVGKSRLYWLKDPLAKQAVRLWTDYAMGKGITWKSEDAALTKTISAFMKDRRNRRLLNSEGQRKSSKKLLVDGEVFFAIFSDGDKKIIRWIDPIAITHIVTDPDDAEHILGYRRLIPAANGASGKSMYYADWTADAEDRAMAELQTVYAQEKITLEKDVVIYHLPFDCIHQRGNSLLSSSLDWTREHRRFMEARVAITQALSKYAFKLGAKGGQKAIAAIKSQLDSSYTSSTPTRVEKNPQNAPAGTFVHNDAIDLQAVPRMTGAGDAATDGNQLKLMVSAGTGIMLHYFGDPSTGNLATATAMELPMLKMFDSYQQLWRDAYMDIFTIVCDDNSEDGIDEQTDDLAVDIDLPPILEADLQAMGTALNSVASLWPEIAENDDILMSVLTAMEVPDVDEALKQLRSTRKAAKAEQDAKDKQTVDLIKQGALPKPKFGEVDSDLLTAALLKMSEAMG